MAVNALSGLRRFFGRAISESAGFGIGGALQRPLEPLLQELTNETWRTSVLAGISIPVDAGDAAEVVAEDVEALSWGEDQAAQGGMTPENFGALVGAARDAPGLPELFELWRRDKITDADFTHGLRKARFETRWDAPLKALKDRLLSPDVLANARQQGFVEVGRQHAESELQGVDTERADILYELSGNPPGPETLLDWLRRGTIDEATFRQGIREGRTKTKYTDDYLSVRQPLLTVHDFVTAHLKGWIDVAAMNAGGALHGYTPEQMNQLYENAGRPAAPGQLWTAAARGIDGPDGSPMDRAQFLRAVKQSDIRPEYGPMLWDIRFLYPPLFQLSRLVAAGQITADIAAEWARKDRYAPEVVDALHAVWSKGATAAESTYVGKAKTQLWTTTHTAFKNGEADETRARENMAAIGIDAADQDAVLSFWNLERATVRKQLTLAQVKTAYRDGIMTRDAVTEMLLGRGYSMADVTTLLGEWDHA